jgi:hypothetical protein
LSFILIMLLALYQQIINVFPGTHCQEVREVLYEVSRLFGTHPLQRSASASDKMDVRLPAWGLPSVAA